MVNAVSDIQVSDLADYLRITELTDIDAAMLSTMLSVAKEFISNYTGQSDLDGFTDFVLVVFVLVQDMWDNRSLYVDKNNVSRVVESILGMHSINLLPEVEI